jgi:hypothetical protein
MTTTDSPEATNDGAAPRLEAPEAKSDLDKLLSEFEGAKPKPTQEPPQDLTRLEPVIRFAQDEMESRARQSIQKDIDRATSFMLEPEELKPIPPKFARGFLEAYAQDNPSFAQAFKSRGNDPRRWVSELEEARKAFAEEAKELPGNTVRTDIEAAKASVSGNKQPPEEPEAEDRKIAAMDGAEFYAYRKKLLAQA